MDVRIAHELVERARNEGLSLTGDDGFLTAGPPRHRGRPGSGDDRASRIRQKRSCCGSRDRGRQSSQRLTVQNAAGGLRLPWNSTTLVTCSPTGTSNEMEPWRRSPAIRAPDRSIWPPLG